MKTEGQGKFGRRDFLRVMGLSVGAGAGLAALAAAPLASKAQADESEKDEKKKLYNPNSPNVKNYYRVNRY